MSPPSSHHAPVAAFPAVLRRHRLQSRIAELLILRKQTASKETSADIPRKRKEKKTHPFFALASKAFVALSCSCSALFVGFPITPALASAFFPPLLNDGLRGLLAEEEGRGETISTSESVSVRTMGLLAEPRAPGEGFEEGVGLAKGFEGAGFDEEEDEVEEEAAC